MRPTRLALGLLLLLPSASGFALSGVILPPHDSPNAEQVQPPELSWEQQPDRILVHIHNVNLTWGLRDTPVSVRLNGESVIIESYHPNLVYRWPDGREFRCCVIDFLPPGGDYTITLPPSRTKVAGLRVRVLDPNAWTRMT